MKPWWQSSTIWLNVGLVGLVAALEALNTSLPPEYAAVAGFLLNILNRFRTTKPIGSG